MASIPLNLIEPFLNEAIVFENDALQAAPRIVATQEGRVLLSRGDTAYVRGELGGATSFRMFRQARPLRDPQTQEVLGYEAPYIGAAELVRGSAEARVTAAVEGDIVPATFLVTLVRQEAGVGDRLAPVPAREFVNYVPHAPQAPITARIVSIYGDALTAGQNQIVALNRGAVDGMERGHVLALWRAGGRVVDRTDPAARADQAARRAARHAVRVPRLPAGVVCAHPDGGRAGAPGRRGDAALTPVVPWTAPPLP